MELRRGVGSARLQLSVHPRAAQLARACVLEVGRCWPDDVREDAVLAVSELVSNAVQHAATGVDLAITDVEGTIRVEVHDDGGPLVPSRHPDGTLQQADGDDEHGRGLSIVAALAARWGVVEQVPAGKVVWFELDLPAAPRS